MRRAAGILLLAGAFGLGAGAAMALPSELRGLVKGPRPAGCSEFGFLFWNFYRAELWSDFRELPGESFGLSLTYRSDFARSDLVDSSVAEMARISARPKSDFAGAGSQLARAFRDVAAGDRITAWRAAPNLLRFFVNGHETGALNEHVDLFLAIWLGAETRDPKGRQALLAGRCHG